MKYALGLHILVLALFDLITLLGDKPVQFKGMSKGLYRNERVMQSFIQFKLLIVARTVESQPCL